MKKALLLVSGLLGGLLAVLVLIVWFGVVDVAADVPHSAAVFDLLETIRERSIAARSGDIQAPDLSDPEAIRRGAGNYDSMCAVCHLAPGKSDTELSRGLYPAPPNLARSTPPDPSRAFWTIKHGIKSTGMPAWGRSMEDRYIWDMVAFAQRLPTMTAQQYAAEVAASGGHSHGGNETENHSHANADEGAHVQEGAGSSAAHNASDAHPHEAPEKSKKQVHTHADGEEHVHE